MMRSVYVEDPDSDLIKDKRRQLFLRYVLLGLVLCLTHTFFDYFYGHIKAALIDAILVGVLVMIYVIAISGKQFLAKILFLSFAYLMVFLLAALVPKGDGIYLIFFPLVTTLFTIFDVSRDKISYFFAFLALLMVIVLEVTDYRIFGDFSLEENVSKHSFVVNLTVGILVVIFSVNFLVKINKKTEDRLRSNQKKLKKLSLEVQEQNEALAKTNAELDRFVYSTSHDLRAPLMSILGLVNLAEKDTDAKPEEYLTRIKSQVKKLDDFIKDIICYSRNTRIEVKHEAIDFEDLVNDVLANFEFMEGAERVEFRKSIDLTKLVKSDRSRISVVLNNLISNAIKYHNYDQPNPYVDISISNTGSRLKLVITDNGQGIPQKYHREIFEMFVRASESSQGSGLGLYIVKEIIEKLGGTITLESEEGKGARFIIELPVEE